MFFSSLSSLQAVLRSCFSKTLIRVSHAKPKRAMDHQWTFPHLLQTNVGARLHSRKEDLPWLGSRALAPQPSRRRVGFSPRAVQGCHSRCVGVAASLCVSESMSIPLYASMMWTPSSYPPFPRALASPSPDSGIVRLAQRRIPHVEKSWYQCEWVAAQVEACQPA